MQVKDLRALLENLSAEFDNTEVVIREFGNLTEGDNGTYFKLDKPIGLAYYDEDTNELALSELDMFNKYKNEGWFPVKEGYVNKYDEHNKPEVNEDGEGAAPAGAATLDSVGGMGAPVLASRGVDGSGDVPSIAVDDKKKKKKSRLLSFEKFSTRPSAIKP